VKPIVSDALGCKDHRQCWTAACNKNWVSMVLDSTCTQYHTHTPNVGSVIGTHPEAGLAFYSVKPIVSGALSHKYLRKCWTAVRNKNWVSMVLDSTCTQYHTHTPNVGLVIGTHPKAGWAFYSVKPI
jgi:hypothetical protein